MIAKAIKRLDGRGVGVVFRLDEPLDGHRYVWVSGVFAPFSGPETYIFGCDEEGEEINFLELDGSFRGDVDLERALNGAGYEVDWNGRIVSKEEQLSRAFASMDSWNELVKTLPLEQQDRIKKLQTELSAPDFEEDHAKDNTDPHP